MRRDQKHHTPQDGLCIECELIAIEYIQRTLSNIKTKSKIEPF